MSALETNHVGSGLRGYGAGFRLLKETRREFWVVQIVMILEAFARFSVLAVGVIFLQQELGLAGARADALFAMITATAAVSVFLVGPFIDWLGIRRSLLLAFGVLFALDLFIVIATSVPGMPGREQLVIGALFATGPFLAMIPVVRFVAQKRYSSRRSRATCYYMGSIAVSLGGFLAPFLVSSVIGGLESRVAAVLLPCTLLTGACLLLVSLLVRSEVQLQGPDERPEPAPPRPPRRPLATLRAVLKAGAFWKVTALYAALTTARCTFIAMALFLPKYLERAVGVDTSSRGVVLINASIATFGMIALLPVVHRWRTYSAICFGSLLVAGSMFLLALPLSGEAIYPTVLLWVIVLSIGEIILFPRVLEYVATVAPVGEEGTYYSLSGVPWPALKMFVSMMAGYLLIRWIPMPPPDQPNLLRDAMEAGEIGYWDSPAVLWLILAGFAVTGPILLIALRRWFTKGTWYA